MKIWLNLSLVLAMSLLATHEMDAMTHSEWRLLPILNGLSDQAGRNVFLVLHIPLFAGLFWALFLSSWARRAGQVFSVVLIGHAGAHFLFSGHDAYSFVPPIETITVYGAAIAAILHLVLSVRVKSE